jgi:hypothetical protein
MDVVLIAGIPAMIVLFAGVNVSMYFIAIVLRGGYVQTDRDLSVR